MTRGRSRSQSIEVFHLPEGLTDLNTLAAGNTLVWIIAVKDETYQPRKKDLLLACMGIFDARSPSFPLYYAAYSFHCCYRKLYNTANDFQEGGPSLRFALLSLDFLKDQ